VTEKEKLDKIYVDIEKERKKLEHDFRIDLSLVPVDDIIELIDYLLSHMSKFERRIAAIWIKRNVKKFIRKKGYAKR